MNPAILTHGLKVMGADGRTGVLVEQDEQGTWVIEGKTERWTGAAKSLSGLPTRYQVYAPNGVAFACGPPYEPASFAHTIVLGGGTQMVRALTVEECRKMLGGTLPAYQQVGGDVAIEAIMPSPPYCIALYVVGIALGVIHVWSTDKPTTENQKTGGADRQTPPPSFAHLGGRYHFQLENRNIMDGASRR